jgi:hypothetical protein
MARARTTAAASRRTIDANHLRPKYALGVGSEGQVWSLKELLHRLLNIRRDGWNVKLLRWTVQASDEWTGCETDARLPSSAVKCSVGNMSLTAGTTADCFAVKRPSANNADFLRNEVLSMVRVRAAMELKHRMHLTPIPTPINVYEVTYSRTDGSAHDLTETMLALRHMDSTAAHELHRVFAENGRAHFCVSLVECVTAFLGFCDALHAQHLVHQDAKLDNMLYAGGNDACKRNAGYVVSDYGFVMRASEMQDMVYGTPGFMSPMLLRGVPSSWVARSRESWMNVFGDLTWYTYFLTADRERCFKHLDFHSMGLSILYDFGGIPFAADVARLLLSGDLDEDAMQKMSRLRVLIEQYRVAGEDTRTKRSKKTTGMDLLNESASTTYARPTIKRTKHSKQTPGMDLLNESASTTYARPTIKRTKHSKQTPKTYSIMDLPSVAMPAATSAKAGTRHTRRDTNRVLRLHAADQEVAIANRVELAAKAHHRRIKGARGKKAPQPPFGP